MAATQLTINTSIDLPMDLTSGNHSTSSNSSFTHSYDDIFVVVGWTAMAVFGFVTNVLILIGILRTKKLYQSTSYWLIISLSICDMAMILICLCHLAPATVLHERYVTLIDFSNALGIFLYDGFWYTGVLHLMIMSINRYISICQPTCYLSVFSRQKTAIMIGCVYILGIVVAIPGLFSCCSLVYNSDIYAAQYEPPDTGYQFMDMAINGSSLVIMTFCYTCIIIRVRRSRVMLHQYRKLYKEQRTLQTKAALVYAKSTKSRQQAGIFARLFKPNVPIISRREVRLFFQFFTVSVIFFASVTTWGWLPQLSESKWVGFVVTSLFFLNNSTNPTVYLIFNSILRRQIQRVICPFRATSSKGKKQQRRMRDEILALGGATAGGWGSVRQKGGSTLLHKFSKTGYRRDNDSDMENSEMYMDFEHRRGRRSTGFDTDEDVGRLINQFETADYNVPTDDPDPDVPTSNATCNLMAMAAFLNTSTVAGRVLMKTVAEEEGADTATDMDHSGRRVSVRPSISEAHGRRNALKMGSIDDTILEEFQDGRHAKRGSFMLKRAKSHKR